MTRASRTAEAMATAIWGAKRLNLPVGVSGGTKAQAAQVVDCASQGGRRRPRACGRGTRRKCPAAMVGAGRSPAAAGASMIR